MRNNFWGKSIGGLVLILIGVVFLLNQTDVIDVDLGYIFSHFWPVILILIGLRGLFAQRGLEHGQGMSFLWSVIMIGLGLVFLNNNMQWIPGIGVDDLFRFAIPVILIVVGLRILFRRRTPKEPEPYEPRDWQPYSKLDEGPGGAPENGPNPQGSTGGPSAAAGGPGEHGGPGAFSDWSGSREQWRQAKREWKRHKHEWKEHWKHGKGCGHNHHGHHHGWYGHGMDNRHNFIGDIRIGQEYWDLKPLNVSHFIGDTEIDLTRANIPHGETRINVSAFIGDVKVFVPNDVQVDVSVNASSFLGDMSVFDRWEGGLFRSMKAESPHYHEAEKRIRINVSMFIGDVRVKRVG